jgi:hypothetical protein
MTLFVLVEILYDTLVSFLRGLCLVFQCALGRNNNRESRV